MNLAFFSESSADEAAIRILIEAVLDRSVTIVETLSFRTRGWNGIRQNLAPLIRYLHYNTDADGLIAVFDSDFTPIHSRAHEVPGGRFADCRLCGLRGEAERVLTRWEHVRDAHHSG